MNNQIKLFPQTRYQGSKFKLLNWIKESTRTTKYNSVLDAFSGTSSVSYLFKTLGKTVYSNDLLKFNYITSKAFIENHENIVSEKELSFILNNDDNSQKRLISNNYSDIYFTDEENIWLDRIIQNILLINNEYKQALCFWALFQSCITKRPYGLFHRKNLDIRVKDVPRSFGNKKTWDTPFEIHFEKFIKQANKAVFNNNNNCKSFNEDLLSDDSKLQDFGFDLVYLDPPYIPQNGSLTRYGEYYHFLEGICSYNEWEDNINLNKKHKPFIIKESDFENKEKNISSFIHLFEKFKESKLLISYRSDGIPSIQDFKEILNNTHTNIEIINLEQQYVLSKKKTYEILIKADHF